jgi:hypothetical protein
MKKIILGFILIITMSFCLLEDNNYYLLFEKANNIKLYKYGKHYYYEYFMDEKKEIEYGNLTSSRTAISSFSFNIIS